ncbi:hypothetical protein Vafri_13673 [Volvox africanus]|uniref:Uncharacterized protein n=1 Tax=Volvox africanus TaxID=51714 RepID=A0A8J4BCS2_9CHLO|nr:hypothetical protein Vafri_13673 [Volvox africanus]
MIQICIQSHQMERHKFSRALLHSSGALFQQDQHHYAGPNTQPLRVASIFLVLAAGLLGGMPPLFMKAFRDPDTVLARLMRSFSAGIILVLALVHIIPEAVEEMSGLGGIEYPLGGTCALGGIALMILLEHVAHIMHNRGGNNAGDRGCSSHSGVQPRTAAPAQTTCKVCVEVPPPSVTAGAMPTIANGGMSAPPRIWCSGAHHPSSGVRGDGGNIAALQGHSQVCVSDGPASNWMAALATEAIGSLRLKVIACLFELGCIFHSVLIGIPLGTNQTDIKGLRLLLIALIFHQCVESISLGCVLTRGGFSVLKGAFMILTYSLACPVGIAVGMAIAKTYNAESTKLRGIQGVFNGVSGGMLLYISLVQLVAEDMGRLVPGRDSAMNRMACFAALCGGAASMCLLAVWV